MLKDERNADLQGTALKTAKQPAANPKEGFMPTRKAEAEWKGNLAEGKSGCDLSCPPPARLAICATVHRMRLNIRLLIVALNVNKTRMNNTSDLRG